MRGRRRRRRKLPSELENEKKKRGCKEKKQVWQNELSFRNEKIKDTNNIVCREMKQLLGSFTL